MWTSIESGHYIVTFELHAADDCPPDFNLSPALSGFDAGLFLPRADPDWFGRSAYPARVLLLTRDLLRIVPHPSTGQSISECPIQQISSIEAGNMLLKGWLRFEGPGFRYTIDYNTRGFRAVSRFMCRLREKLLDPAGAETTSELRLGAGLDIKFGNALSRELDPGERVSAQFFQPPKVRETKLLFIPRRHWLPGDLIVLTNRRLMWISDRERGFRSPYGSVASYAPLRAVRRIEPKQRRDGRILNVHLDGGASWKIPIASGNLENAVEFAKLHLYFPNLMTVSMRSGENLT
jgi:hypothetical protein